jgi:type IV pilus assembly protein PilW
MVAVTLSIVVLAGILGVVNTQQRAYLDGQKQREAQGSGREALRLIEEQLLLAGYGMDAPLAFDFGRYAGPCPAQLAPCPRDAIANSDEIVFFHRNPRYWVPSVYTAEPAGNAWRLLGLTLGTATVSARATDRFMRGQILQAVCKSGTEFAYFTVAETSAAGQQELTLAAVDLNDPFRRQDDALAPARSPCFLSGEARVFRIERHRFHVRPVNTGAGLEPYLMHDQGVDRDLDGAVTDADELPIAGGVELLQFGYLLTNPALAMRGGTPGTAIAAAAGDLGTASAEGLTTLQFPGPPQGTLSAYRATSFYGYSIGPPPHDRRLTDHQANIRAVRVAVRARSNVADRGVPPLRDTLVPLLNLNALPAWIDVQNDRYSRVTFVSTVPVRNMTVRAMNDF